MKHITVEQRYAISAMKELGLKQKDIAIKIGRDKSVVSRELSRNCDQRSQEYHADLAQRKYLQRQREKPKHIRFTEEVKLYVDELLKKDYSPEQIAGRAKFEETKCVTHERIYQYVWKDKKDGGELHEHLRHKGRKYRKRGAAKDKRGIVKNRVDIDMRPKIVDEKYRFGDFEIDTVIGKNHKGALLTINERVTKLTWIRLLAGKEAEPVTEKTVNALMPIKHMLHTITADNGKEFAGHEKIAKELDADSTTISITEPDVLIASIDQFSAPLCYASTNGQAIVSISGGTIPYDILWSDSTGISSDTNSTLAGNQEYYVWITDSNNCMATDTIYLDVPALLTSSGESSDAHCITQPGWAVVTGMGGTMPYAYLWDDIDHNETDSVTNLAAGTYGVTITDANYCTTTWSVNIVETAVGSLSVISKQDVGCFGDSTGSVEINMTGGIAPYTYHWAHDLTNATDSSMQLFAGVYAVTVTDVNSCTADTMITVSQPSAPLSSFIGASEAECYGSSTGNLLANVEGGTSPYTYLWNTSATLAELSDLPIGDYAVTVTDANGCSSLSSRTMTQPSPLSASDTVLVTPQNLGSIELTVSGGSSPYDYAWSTGAVSEDIADLENGIYTVTITDMRFCEIIDTIEVTSHELALFIPNFFTPNHDGFNDDFRIGNIQYYSHVSIEIYGRWGDIIYHFNGSGIEYTDANVRWDGTFQGKDQPAGSFVYIVIVDELEPFTGVVTIVR